MNANAHNLSYYISSRNFLRTKYFSAMLTQKHHPSVGHYMVQSKK